MKNKTNSTRDNVLKVIATDRERTNFLRGPEQRAIAFLVEKVPGWISSNMLTTIGLMGSVIVFASFILAKYVSTYLLLIGVFGFIVSWFGDSLDGRIAYYRNKARKLYGFALDITMDWLGIILMGFGFVVYLEGVWEIIGFTFVVLYGWEMITTLLRYKITGKYSIDSGLLSPTEVRIILSLFLITEVCFNDTIKYIVILANIIILVTNITDTRKLLRVADEQDKKEKELAQQQTVSNA